MLATDPDADRLGVYVKDAKSGDYIPLTGNMSGSLLCEYVLSQKKERGAIPEDGQVVKSIVTTNLVDAVAKSYGCELIEVLTGFKYIGQQILKEENTGYGTYLFGLEESYGCLIGTYARDKDAISATVALCEAAAYYMEFWGKMKVDDYMQGVYCGIGVGLICSGIVFLIRNKRLMKDEEKLKEARLQVTDERNIEIGSRALRMAAFVLLIVMYFAFLFGGLYDPMISKLMSCMICLFLIVYAIAWRVLNKHM